MKEQLLLTNVKYLRLSTEHLMHISILYICMCTILKNIGINKEKEMCLPNKESISGHKYERTNMATKCEMFCELQGNLNRNLKKKLTVKQGIHKGL